MIKKNYSKMCAMAFFITSIAISGCNDKGGAEGYSVALKNAIGPDVKDYQALSYPTNSFGIATTYLSPASGKVRDEDFLCATFKCLGVDAADKSEDLDAANKLRVRAIEYAAIGRGGPLKLNSSAENDYALKVTLPKILQILNLGAGFDSKSVTKVDLELGPSIKRYLNKPDFVAYLNSSDAVSPTKVALQKAFGQGALVVVVGDVLIESVKATITASNEFSPNLEAKLGGLPSKVFSDAEASFKLTKKGNSTYVVESVGPVIALRLLRAQPGAGMLGAQSNWDDWSIVEGPISPSIIKAP